MKVEVKELCVETEEDVKMSIFYDTYYEFDDEDWKSGMPYPGRWL